MFPIPQYLENDKVLMRLFTADDFEPLHQVASDPQIWEQHKQQDRYKKEVFRSYFDPGLADGMAFVIIDKTTNQIIGSSRFERIKGVENAIEIGWTFLARTYWGGEYNRSFKTLMLDHAFQHFDAVAFYVAGNNQRSKKAVAKLGGEQIFDPHDPLYNTKPNYSSFVIWKRNWTSK